MQLTNNYNLGVQDTYTRYNGYPLADKDVRIKLADLATELRAIAVNEISSATLTIREVTGGHGLKVTIGNVTSNEVTIPQASFIQSARYESTTHKLVLVFDSGTETEIDLGGLIDVYTGADTSTTQTVVENGTIKVSVKNGSITQAMLATDVSNAINVAKEGVVQNLNNTTLNLARTGTFKVTNASENPCGLGQNGILVATAVNDTVFKQTWTTQTGEAFRILSISETGVPTNLNITDETGTVRTVTQAGEVKLDFGHTYTLSGTLAGHIVIDAPAATPTAVPTENTTLKLSGLYVYSDVEKAINYNPHEKKLIVDVQSGTVNTLYCHAEEAISSAGAALYSSSNLDVCGCGYLSIFTNTGAHGIKADRVRLLNKPHLYIDAKHDAIHGKTNSPEYMEDASGNTTTEIADLRYAVEIKDCYLYVAGANDVIGTDADTDPEKAGSIRITGGEFQLADFNESIFDAKGVKNSRVEGFTSINVLKATHNWATKETIDVLETVSGVPSTYTKKITDLYFYDDEDETRYYGHIFEEKSTDASYGEHYFISEETPGTELTLTGDKITISGYINKKIILPTKQTDVILKEAYLAGGIDYQYVGKKLSVKVEVASTNTSGEAILPYENLSSYVVSASGVAIDSKKNLKLSTDAPLFVKGVTTACKSYDLILNGDADKRIVGDVSATTLYIGADNDKYEAGTAGNSKGFVYLDSLHINHRADKTADNLPSEEEGIFRYYRNQKGDVYIKSLTMTAESHVTTGRWSIDSDKPSLLYIESVTDTNEPKYVNDGYIAVSLTNGSYKVATDMNGWNISGDWVKQSFNINNYLLKTEEPSLTTFTTADFNTMFKGGWKVEFDVDSHVHDLAYYKTKSFAASEKVTLGEGEYYCAYDKDLAKKSYYEDAQANFIFYVDEGYVLDQITITGTKNKLENKTTEELGALGGYAYNITKVQSDLTVHVTTKVQPTEPDGWKIDFTTSHATVDVYQIRWNEATKHTNVTTDYTVSGNVADQYIKTDGQISFQVNCEEGYEVKSISPAAQTGVTYKNLKIYDGTTELSGATVAGHSRFSMTKVSNNLNVVITVGPIVTVDTDVNVE